VKSVCVLIGGRVQGVWFRGWTRQQAARLGLDGWVRIKPIDCPWHRLSFTTDSFELVADISLGNYQIVSKPIFEFAI
jgi:hypothetical protein